ncbi:hypothetical protein [Microbaculum marinisediminis]|uniref:Uncharacterized protein n=1 Tax=Microbaculum marinisediminis TaxID=2931392 RepID=A0AAW5R637_9HYPH|nr:hypothetical protein [Microbaculum sp. A6E488]MCT8974845.1 hypothetical protein [Microbaculum sp. A6E488]
MSARVSGRTVYKEAGLALVLIATGWFTVAGGAPAAGAATGDPDGTPHSSFFYMSCEGTPCQRQMYRVPDGRRLKVFALSCAAQVTTPGHVSHIGVRREMIDGGEVVVDLASNRVGVQGNTQYFAFRADTDTVVDGGVTVNAFVDSTGDVDAFYCFLAGDLIAAH